MFHRPLAALHPGVTPVTAWVIHAAGAEDHHCVTVWGALVVRRNKTTQDTIQEVTVLPVSPGENGLNRTGYRTDVKLVAAGSRSNKVWCLAAAPIGHAPPVL